MPSKVIRFELVSNGSSFICLREDGTMQHWYPFKNGWRPQDIPVMEELKVDERQ